MDYPGVIIGIVGLGLAWLFYIRISELSEKTNNQLSELKSVSAKFNDQVKEFKTLSDNMDHQLDELRLLDKEVIKEYKRQETAQKILNAIDNQVQKAVNEKASYLTPAVQSQLTASISSSLKDALFTNDLEGLGIAPGEQYSNLKRRNRL